MRCRVGCFAARGRLPAAVGTRPRRWTKPLFARRTRAPAGTSVGSWPGSVSGISPGTKPVRDAGAAPRRRVRALRGGERRQRLIERGPQRRAARVERSVAAVAQVELALARASGRAACAGPCRRRTRRQSPPSPRMLLSVAEQVAVHRPHHGLGDRSPHGVHDRRAGVVVVAVEVGVEARRVALHPVVEHRQGLRVERVRCRRCRAAPG